MYEHICAGAECPHCSPFTVGKVTELRKAVIQSADYPLLDESTARLAQHLRKQYAANDAKAERLRQFRDSCGNPVQTWPKGEFPRPSTTIIIVKWRTPDGSPPWEVLCQQRADNAWWGFPGGSVNVGESLIGCAEREAREETGLVVYIRGAVCIDSDPMNHAICTYADGTVHYVNTTFVGRAIGGELRCSAESLALRWCPTDDLPQPFLLNHAWRLQQAMEHKGTYLPVR